MGPSQINGLYQPPPPVGTPPCEVGEFFASILSNKKRSRQPAPSHIGFMSEIFSISKSTFFGFRQYCLFLADTDKPRH